MADLTVDTDRVLVGARRLYGGIEPQVAPWIDDRNECRITAGRGIERRRGRRCCPGMERRQLAGQNALRKPPVTGSQDSAAIVGELRGDSKPRRPHVPRVQRAQSTSAVRVARPSQSSTGKSWLTARLWSKRRPALTVSALPIVTA